MDIRGYAATKPKDDLSEHTYTDEVGADEVAIKITHCGICHSDIHLIDDDWGMSNYPFIPGHEIVGIVEKVGDDVTNLKEGQRVGVGWQAGSCHECEWCMSGEQENCPEQQATCVGRNGGYAEAIIVDSKFAVAVPEGMKSAQTAPMLCGGITVYKPLHEHVQAGDRVAVVGIGGLGHFAVQFADAMGCHVTAISTHSQQADHYAQLGADEVIDAKDEDALNQAAGSFDLILNTAPVELNWEAYLNALRPRGTLVQLSPATNIDLSAFSIIGADKNVVGSHIGSPALIKKMLEFADRNGIGASIETYPLEKVNEALKRSRSGEAQYRVVLEMDG